MGAVTDHGWQIRVEGLELALKKARNGTLSSKGNLNVELVKY
jgi:hypothetical protein